MKCLKVLVVVQLSLLFLSVFSRPAHAECYGVYSQQGWTVACGEVPAPPSKYAVSTALPSVNQLDKLYLCSLVQLSDTQCNDVVFWPVYGGLFSKEGVVQSTVSIRMEYNGKQCAGAVWKTYQRDSDTWVLASPTSIFGFPSSCEIPGNLK
jgi:hypothetical protein